MRIPVRVEFFAGGLRPIVTITIRSDSPKIFGIANAIIDTGSPTTLLGAGDVQRMRISQVQMQKLIGAEKDVNMGGSQLKTRELPEGKITVGGKEVTLSSIKVPVKIEKGTPPPTILGIDFLIEGKFKFFFYPDKKESYLETED